jgi:hypothetical protein
MILNTRSSLKVFWRLLFFGFFLASATCDSVSSPQLEITSADRVANRTSITATLSFSTSSTGLISSQGSITLSYPSFFFAPQATPTIGFIAPSLFEGSCDAITENQIVITTPEIIDLSTLVIITITGLTMGSATVGSSTGITVETSGDTTTSAGSPSGVIVSIAAVAESIIPETVYATGIITVIGNNFISGFDCTAEIGQFPGDSTLATSCVYVSVTELVVVLHEDTEASILPGTASTVKVAFIDSGISVIVPNTPLHIVSSPVISSI